MGGIWEVEERLNSRFGVPHKVLNTITLIAMEANSSFRLSRHRRLSCVHHVTVSLRHWTIRIKTCPDQSAQEKSRQDSESGSGLPKHLLSPTEMD